MAKGGNTWCKKLMTKAKQQKLRRMLGNEQPVMGYCLKARPITARPLNRETIEDKPLPRGVNNDREFYGPMVEGFRPRRFGRGRSGCVYRAR